MDNVINGIRPLSDREFQQFQRLIYREAGIFLSDAKKALVTGRLLRRIRALGLTDFGAYYEQVEDSGDERTAMLNQICTNETRFFREPKQFDFLDQEFLPEWKLQGESGAIPKKIRVWSAACSSGEEPYSLAMLLGSHLPESQGWSVEIVASDLSTKVLAQARDGVWPVERAQDIPPAYLKAFMFRGVGAEDGRMRANPQLKSMIDFRQINLNSADYGMTKPFDLIFCRNVLIYFSRDSKAAVLGRLVRLLSPAGLLFLGHAESLNGSMHGVEHAGPTCYRRL